MRRNFVLACALLCLLAPSALAVTFSGDFILPIGNGGFPTGITNNGFVGVYSDSAGRHGFSFNGSTFVTVDEPLATQGASLFAPTVPMGAAGVNVIGQYGTAGGNHAFLYDGTTYTTLEPQATTLSSANGIDGSNIVGYYLTPVTIPNTIGSIPSGYLYNGSTFTPVNDPLGVFGTTPQGISGNTIVGSYLDASSKQHGFIFNGSTYTTIDYSTPITIGGTRLVGVSGGNIVGNYSSHAFLYDGSTFTSLDDPLGVSSTILGISGNTALGWYFDSANVIHPYLATIPEPSSIALAGFGLVCLGGMAVRRWRA